MNVEFIGLPGVGKSYLCRALEQMIRERGAEEVEVQCPPVDEQLRLVTQAGKLLRAFRFLTSCPFVVAELGSLIRGSEQSSRRDLITKTINLLSELQRNRRRGVPLVNEQGLLQAVWSLGLRAEALEIPRLVERVANWLPHMVILVEVDRKEHLRRLTERKTGRSRLESLDARRIEAELERGSVLLDQIIEIWRRSNPGGNYVRIINDGSADLLEVLLPVLEIVQSK